MYGKLFVQYAAKVDSSYYCDNILKRLLTETGAICKYFNLVYYFVLQTLQLCVYLRLNNSKKF